MDKIMMPRKSAKAQKRKTTVAATIIVVIIALEQLMALPIGSISRATLLPQQKY